jgi:predicted metallopeptidase
MTERIVQRLSIPSEVRWGSAHGPLPTEWVLPEGRPLPRSAGDTPLDFCRHMRRLCTDIAARCETLHHIRMPRVLLSFTPSRNRNRFGLQARVTPMRFRAGGTVRTLTAREYQVQRYFVNDVEMLYLMTFCLPRFFNQPFEEKLSTVFHEMFHIGPSFDGDLRRHDGRYAVHSRSKADYEANVDALMAGYLKGHDRPELFDFLRHTYRNLWLKHGGIRAVIVPRPKLLPIGRVLRTAAKEG